MLSSEHSRLARLIWDYHHMKHPLKKADAIFALGSHDTRVAERAADLYLEGWAPLVIFSGGLGNLTQHLWQEAEADIFARIAIEMGVPPEHILIENRSTNTGENVQFTRNLLTEKGLDPPTFILVQKPYMERRTYATFKKNWPEKEFLVTSPQLSFDAYPNEMITQEKVVHIMIGDLQRIKVYPEKGFQIPQPIPDEVWDAYEQLVEAGFTGHLIKES